MKNFKIIPVVLFFCFHSTSFSQEIYDEEVMMKACSCIYNSSDDNIDSVIDSCIIKALLHSLSEDNISKDQVVKDYLENNNTEIKTTFGIYLEQLLKHCSSIHYLVEKKQTQYYKMSGSDKANQYYLAGLDFQSQNNPDSAIISFKNALTYDSLFVLALDNLGTLYEKTGETNKAINSYLRSIHIFPEGFTALANLGNLYSFEEKNDLAIKTFTQLIKYYAENPEGYFGLGSIAFSDHNYEAATHLMKYAYYNYLSQHSEQQTHDCIEYLKAAYYYMSKEGRDSVFIKIAPEFIPEIYQPENFNQLQNIELNNEIDCRLMEPQILICVDYILSTPINQSDIKRTYAIEAIKRWMNKTPNYIFHIDKDVAPILDREGNVLSVFISAMCKFSIENPDKGNDQQAVASYAWNTILDYAANKSNNVPLTSELKKRIKKRN